VHGEVQQTPPANAQAEILHERRSLPPISADAKPRRPCCRKRLLPKRAKPELALKRATCAPPSRSRQNGVRILLSIQGAGRVGGVPAWRPHMDGAFDTKREIDVSELIADHTRSFSDVTVADTTETARSFA
jgi:hypothetical protein